MFKKLFGGNAKKEEERKEEKRRASVDKAARREEKRRASEAAESKAAAEKVERAERRERAERAERKQRAAGAATEKKRRKKGKKPESGESAHVDTSKPLEYPCTPEIIIEYHKRKPFLSANEEWLVVELNEYECLVDGDDIISIIAKHSKFFELDPPELWEEFFEFVEDVPSYDEVINYDVWQEFRDKCYPC